MGRGSSKLGGGSVNSSNGGTAPKIKTTGNITFSDMMKIAGDTSLSDGSISFNKTVTILPNGRMPESGRKKDLGNLINKYNVKKIVVDMYRDKSGANDLNRLNALGFTIQARYMAQSTSSRIPPRDYYYLVKKGK